MLSFNDGSFFKSIRVFGGAEPPADSDRRLVVATAALQPYRATTQKIFQAPARLYIVDAELRPCRQI